MKAAVAALGHRELPWSGKWAEPPEVPAPEDSPVRRLRAEQHGTIADRLEMRTANARGPFETPGPPGDGRSALWVRMPDLDLTEASLLAIFGDYVPFGIGQSLGQRAGGQSLDNTIRIAHRVTANDRPPGIKRRSYSSLV